MSIAFSGAVSANLGMISQINDASAVAQKRVSTGKKIFSAADDAARFRMSETMLIRSRQIGSVNNNISLGLKTLQSVDHALKSVISLATSAQDLARRALSEGADAFRGTTSTTLINASTIVSPALVNGSRFSITSDGGGTFSYTFNASAATTTWGTVINALNASGAGVVGEFVPGAIFGQSLLRFRSTNGEDFTFNAETDQNAILALGGITSPNGIALNAANQFATGAAAPSATETGFTIAYGGAPNTSMPVTGGTAIAAGSLLIFKDGNGEVRSLNYPAATTVSQFMSDINGMNIGLRAYLMNTGGAVYMRLRNTNSGHIEILNGTGSFAGPAGAVRFSGLPTGAVFRSGISLSTNSALRLTYGLQYDAVITQMNNIIVNVPVTTGRNLIAGNNMSVTMDEFSGAAITIAGANLTGSASTNTKLGLTAGLGGTSWGSDGAIQNSIAAMNGAISALQGHQAIFSTFTHYMKSRFDMNAMIARDLDVEGNDLAAADVAEESAKLTALQTQQQFAVQAFSMGAQTQQSLLRLLG